MGLRGSGKTTLALSLLQPLPERLVIVDTGGEIAARGLVPAASVDTLRETMLSQESYRLACQPSDIETVEYIVDACAARSDITFMVDELDIWYPSYQNMPCEGLRNVALTGRHYGQTGILVTHRPQNIHPILLSQAVLFVFPMTDSRDREAVQRHSRRPSIPSGLDPAALEVLERDGLVVYRTQLARIDRYGAQILEMTLPDGCVFSGDTLGKTG